MATAARTTKAGTVKLIAISPPPFNPTVRTEEVVHASPLGDQCIRRTRQDANVRSAQKPLMVRASRSRI